MPAAIAIASTTHGQREQPDVDELLRAGQLIGRPGMISWSFPKAMFEPQNETEPMIAANRIGISVLRARGRRPRVPELDPRDQRHRAAADAVEQRHHLRHRGHLHAARRGDADRRADRHAEHDQAPVADAARRSSVAATAIAMPTAAIMLPRAPCAGWSATAGPTMNIEKATM